MKLALSILLMSIFGASQSFAFDAQGYQAKVEEAASDFLIGVSLSQVQLKFGISHKRASDCFTLGALSYTTNKLFNYAANGDSTDLRRQVANQLLKDFAEIAAYCGIDTQYSAAAQIGGIKSFEKVGSTSQLLGKLQDMEAIATKIKSGEVR